jgi:hypothetical protein
MALFRTAVENDPSFAEAWYNLAFLSTASGAAANPSATSKRLLTSIVSVM